MSKPALDTLGKRLKAVRTSRGLTQDDIGEICAVTHTAVQLWEADKTKPSSANLQKVATFFGTTSEWLWEGRGDAPELGEDRTPGGRRRRSLRMLFGGKLDPSFIAAAAQHEASETIAEIAGGIGAGRIDFKTADVIDRWRIPGSVLREATRASSSQLVILRQMTDLMEPTILRGDYVLLDLAQAEYTGDDGVWAIDDGKGLRLRRITQGDAGEPVAVNDNQRFPQGRPLDAEVRIVGRYVGRFTIG